MLEILIRSSVPIELLRSFCNPENARTFVDFAARALVHGKRTKKKININKYQAPSIGKAAGLVAYGNFASPLTDHSKNIDGPGGSH